jgi:hypothetical protein
MLSSFAEYIQVFIVTLHYADRFISPVKERNSIDAAR